MGPRRGGSPRRRADLAVAAAREAITEIERIRVQEVNPSELSLATSYLDGVFPIRYETTDTIAGALATLVEYGLPDDFYDTYREHVRQVTTEQVLHVARTHLHPSALQMLVVGDLDAVQDSLETLDFGKAYVYDTQGQVLSVGS